jgi:hypothetical protein
METHQQKNSIPDILAEILRVGILRIRDAGFAGDAALCAIEADHIHNLPRLVLCPKEPLLQFYWGVERPSYLRAIRTHAGARADTQWFESLWLQLAACPQFKGSEPHEG